MDSKYGQHCIKHDESVLWIYGLSGHNFHIKDLDENDWEVCFGPFANCAPPELNENVWDIIFANEPDWVNFPDRDLEDDDLQTTMYDGSGW